MPQTDLDVDLAKRGDLHITATEIMERDIQTPRTPTTPNQSPTPVPFSSASSFTTLVNLSNTNVNIAKDKDRKEPEFQSPPLCTPDTSPKDLEKGPDPPAQSPPYHVFSRSRKKQMVYIVSLAALFSPLSSNIYFPALGDVSRVSDRCTPFSKFGNDRSLTNHGCRNSTCPCPWPV
ncbi:hypothetical protein VTN96DRAFT_9679 [Rasamsonia emersonii]